MECRNCNETLIDEYQTCPKCGEKNPLDAVECRNCNETLIDEYQTCPKSGEKNPLDAKRCKCGYPLIRETITVKSFDEFIQNVEEDNYTLIK